MNLARWTRRLFRTTRGKIILLLRHEPRIVADLAGELNLTDNAVRAHLVNLERDGLVHQVGERAGFRKPHLTYQLTEDADGLFPKAYGTILNQVISVLKERMGGAETETVLREVGRRIAPAPSASDEITFEKRLDQGVKTLENLGGHATVEKEDGKLYICGAACPLAAASADHGEICKMVETTLSEIIGTPVQQACLRESQAQCRFEVQTLA